MDTAAHEREAAGSYGKGLIILFVCSFVCFVLTGFLCIKLAVLGLAL